MPQAPNTGHICLSARSRPDMQKMLDKLVAIGRVYVSGEPGQESLKKSAYARLPAVILVLMAVEGLLLYLAWQFGEGANILQKVVNSVEALLLLLLLWIPACAGMTKEYRGSQDDDDAPFGPKRHPIQTGLGITGHKLCSFALDSSPIHRRQLR
jgi:hypothetical protein